MGTHSIGHPHHARVLMRQKRVGSMALSRCTWGTQQFSLLPERATLNLPAAPDVDTYPHVRTEPSLRLIKFNSSLLRSPPPRAVGPRSEPP